MEIHGMAGHLIRRLQQRSAQVFHAETRAAGIDLTSVQFAALDAIRAEPGIDQAGVASLIAYDRATIGGVIERLIKKGYVARSISARDRRARELRLTAEGEAGYAEALPIVRRVQKRILSGLNETEQTRLLALVEKATAEDTSTEQPAPRSETGPTG